MKAIGKKLQRDLIRLWGQGITIALVVAVGIASYITLIGAYRSLFTARETFYAKTQFADIFARLERAPAPLARRIELFAGVALVETRIVEDVLVPLPDLREPATARVISLPHPGAPALNRLDLVKGVLPRADRNDEAVALDSFVVANHLALGDAIPVVFHGVLRHVRIVGTALSPEYIFATSGTGFVADRKSFAVLWMDPRATAAAFRMEGAFNDVGIRLQPGASQRDVIDNLDQLLLPYGGFGAQGRDGQPSHVVLANELAQLEREANLPLLFLAVGAFLLNVVLSRLVQLQRGQIAVLKAVGYRRAEIGLHYLTMGLCVVGIGAAAGVGLGVVLGRGMLLLYAPYFHLPAVTFTLEPDLLASVLGMSFLAGGLGAIAAVLRVVRLPPAEAMQPEAPPTYRRTLLERLHTERLFEPAGRMVFREFVRRPLRALLNVTGVALAMAVAVTGRISYDMVETLQRVQFETAMREDLRVSFRKTLPQRAVVELLHQPGVLAAEGIRIVPVRLRSGARSRQIALTLHPEALTLHRIVTWPLHTVAIPAEGLLLTDVLATILGVQPGDFVDIDILEGTRAHKRAVVSGIVHDLFGLNAYASFPFWHGLAGEVEGVSSALLSVDPQQDAPLTQRLIHMPNVARIDRRRSELERFETESGKSMWITATVLTLFGVVIATGVIYNAARVALSMRSRDFASLRVLGFTPKEIGAVLAGELVAYVALAALPGLLLGVWFIRVVMGEAMQEMFRLPIVASPLTFTFAIGVTAIATLVSIVLMRGRLATLDLIAVLKTKE